MNSARIESVKAGSVIVKLYPRTKGNKAYWQIADYLTGQRVLCIDSAQNVSEAVL